MGKISSPTGFDPRTVHSVASCYTDYTASCFVSVEVGAYGSSSDYNVFKNSTIVKLLDSNKLNIPDPRVLPSDAEVLSLPFVLVGEQAFALSEHVLRSYPNKR